MVKRWLCKKESPGVGTLHAFLWQPGNLSLQDFSLSYGCLLELPCFAGTEKGRTTHNYSKIKSSKGPLPLTHPLLFFFPSFLFVHTYWHLLAANSQSVPAALFPARLALALHPTGAKEHQLMFSLTAQTTLPPLHATGIINSGHKHCIFQSPVLSQSLFHLQSSEVQPWSKVRAIQKRKSVQEKI